MRGFALALLQGTDQDLREDHTAAIEQIEEQINDIDKQLGVGPAAHAVDQAQLDWLTRSLVASWRNPAVRGRVLLFHHPPYVTEQTKWDQAQTLAVRHHLRAVLDRVAAALGSRPAGRPLVDLVISGHAHCLEVLHSLDTGHGDARIPWVICGGSGYSLRRQRSEGSGAARARGRRWSGTWPAASCSWAAAAGDRPCGAPTRPCGWMWRRGVRCGSA